MHYNVAESSVVVYMARFVKMSDGTAMIRGDVSTVVLTIRTVPDGTTVTSELLTAANTFETALKTDALWDIDTIGYTFKHVIDGETLLVSANVKHEFLYTITPSAAPTHVLQHRARFDTENLYGV
jgi:hypothetical protein